MLADNNLQILIQTKIEQNSWKTLNQQLEELKKKYENSGLDLRLNIDQRTLSILSDFNKNMSQLAQSTQNQSKASQSAADSINRETESIKKATEAQKQWNIEQQKTIKDGQGKPLSVTTTFGNTSDNSKQTVTTLPDGSIKKIVDTTNAKKDLADWEKLLDEAYKANEKFDKDAETLDKAHFQALRDNQARIEAMDKMHYQALQKNRDIDLRAKQQADKEYEALDRAHYQALRDDQAKFEAMDKMHYLALQKNRDYDLKQQQIADAQEKQHYLALQENQRREDDFDKRKLDLQNKILDVQRRFAGDKTLVANLDNLFGSTQQIDTIGNYKKALSDLESQLKRYITTANSAKSNSISLGEAFSTALTKFPVWIAASTLFVQSLHFFTDGIGYINELNSALTQISIVTGKSQNDLISYAKDYNNLAKEMSVTTKDIANASVEFYRQGLNQVQVMDRVRVATEYAKISNLDFNDSAQILTATTNSMGVSIEKASDVFAYLGRFCPLTA